MKEIKLNQMPDVINECLQKCLNGEMKFANVMFVAEAKYEKYFHRVFSDWREKQKDISMLFMPLPITPFSHEVNGILVPKLKDGKEQFCFANNDIDAMNRPNSVVIFERFNWGQSEEGIAETKDILKKRTYSPCYNNDTYVLNNLKLVVATAYPDIKGYHNIDISNEIKESFEIYEIVRE